MPRKELKNKPLVEVILELRWILPAAGMGGDPDYHLLLGRFSERVESAYPFHEMLPTAQIPDAMAIQVVQHRFRTGKDRWPLVQMGGATVHHPSLTGSRGGWTRRTI
ncbi:TIGR04255 family protein [Methylacidimicrobium sp. B4]|nr:TIGR04255 family protein [Methylacidimicrobium sp. B4]